MVGLGLQRWPAFGLAAAQTLGTRSSAVDVRTPLATPVPEPTTIPMPPPNLRRNAAMGCARGAPAPSPTVVFGAKDYETSGPAPNEIALTFDDGPTPSTSPPILDYLEQTHTPATFFVLGLYARSWPDIIQREWRDGFAIGVHSWDHSSMPFVPDDLMAHQFGDTLAAIHAAIGDDACIWFWRPPYGAFNDRVIGFARRYGLTTIQWNDDPRDWARPGPEAIARVVLAEAHPGSIILMHDGPAHREQTAAALPLILAGLRARGLTPVTIPRLLADSHYPGVVTVPDHQRTPPAS
jgi:peptidoglycan/xylan/chitin deacetylase (PgdA/CDA1 family)